MGLVFVLLLRRDEPVGFTAGSAAAVMGVVMTRNEQPWPMALVGILATGATIGFLIGTLVARPRHPVVRRDARGLLQALQGFMLLVISRAHDPYHNETILAIMKREPPDLARWDALAVVVLAGYAAVALRVAPPSTGPAAGGAPDAAASSSCVVIAALTLGATAYLSAERRATRS